MARAGRRLDDEIDEFGAAGDDDFFDGAIGDEALDIGVGESKGAELVGLIEQVGADLELGAELTVDLDDNLDGVGLKIALFPSGPSIIGVQMFEHFGSEVGSKGLQETGERDEIVGCGAGFVKLVDVLHEGGNGGVEVVAIEVGGDFFDGLMAGGKAGGVVVSEGLGDGGRAETESPTAIEEAENATDGLGVPSGVLVIGADEHFVSAQSVGAVTTIDDFERVDDVTLGLGHFFAVGGVDIAVVEEFLDGFAEREVALVSEEFAPEADVE